VTPGHSVADGGTDDVAARERILDALDAETVHGITVTDRRGETVYCVVSYDDDHPEHGMMVTNLRTVVVDFADDSVTVTDNGLWVPQRHGIADKLTQLLGRTTTDLNGADLSDASPVELSAIDDDADDVLDREIAHPEAVDGQHTDMMDRHGGIDPSREWGYGAGPPPEVADVIDRLEAVECDPSEHLARLQWGKKEPHDRKPRPVEELVGNYGIELQPREAGLVALDIDYPEEFPDDDLPATLAVSSPHGSDDRQHRVYWCEDKAAIAEELGAWAVQSIEWGDLWIGDRYLVGPGSQLSEYGCDHDIYERGEAGGCEACEDPEGGYYRVVEDRPIATVDAAAVLGLLDDSEGYERRTRGADPDPPGDDEDDDGLRCDNCGRPLHPGEAKLIPTGGGDERAICRGGCDG
jgi:hypothetical protein